MNRQQVVSTKARRLRHLLLVALGQDEVGRLVARAREDAGLTQPELATRVGLKHPQSISRYERGETMVPISRLRKIAEATGKPITFFLSEPATQPTPPDAERWARVEAQVGEIRDMVERLLAAAG